MGNPRKPTKLKMLEGTFQPCRHNNEPEYPDSVDITCPQGLKGTAKKCWQDIAPLLHGQGLLTEVDKLNLMQYCALWKTSLEYIKSGKPVPSDVLTQFRMFSAMFGLDPSSRGKLNVGKPKEKSNPFDKNARKTG